ncbi:16S rRNA (uracil(1498)-N(3))-methyltransferase [Mycetocola lacteus]|uniref:Ribosomal RNA small subunit methyltransferase E n=1 Tax=Mycetocola lacteus TaxID=76637 RepID=A0A3L7ARK7_9MICO|nr:16S rRNA (uracil(1498)-N(3))-methyltransferase [Mycetocola lacteus]RLP82200.1 16S rRNA (uracil(1498)-N(3))-methyltransferase [Mycetocola lacteus]
MSSLFLRDFVGVPAVGDTITLEGAEAKHAVTVNRIRVGEELFLGDGAGLLIGARVTVSTPGLLEAEALSVEVHPLPTPELFLVQALAKGDRDEMAVQAATELGVSGVYPWAAERSISRWDAQKKVKGRARWATIAREATKQSIRPHLAHVHDLLDLAGVAALAADHDVLVLDPTAPVALTSHMAARETDDTRPIVLVVGPEGGISSRELDVLEQAGAHRVVLGTTILRTSTAGPAALAVITAALGRW